MRGGAMEQLQGQIASAKIPLSRMISPQLYWVMSGDEFTLDINNPDDPKVLVVGNNPDRQNIYGAGRKVCAAAQKIDSAAAWETRGKGEDYDRDKGKPEEVYARRHTHGTNT